MTNKNLAFVLTSVLTSLLVLTANPVQGADLPAVDHNWDAKHCEFYVNSLGLEQRHYGGGGYDRQTMVSYLSVDEQSLVTAQGGTIERVGILTNGRDVTLASKIEPAYYTIRVDLLHISAYQGISYRYDLDNFVYFVDVKRASGIRERLWLKDGAQHFQWPVVFSEYPQWRRDLGPNSDVYVLEPSPIYHQKQSCSR